MTPEVVVDIGNTRMKWGLCRDGRVTEVLRLPLDEPAAWEVGSARLPPPAAAAGWTWAVASVNPPALHRFLAWSAGRGRAVVFEKYSQLPIAVGVEEPAGVGIDRLLGAVAARALTAPGTAAITVDVGTAVTVNLIDPTGTFRGGAILPGPRLMGRSLRDFTARLPLIDPASPVTEDRPAGNTGDAIRLGIAAALEGGVDRLVTAFARRCPAPPELFITGGGHHLLDSYRNQFVAGTHTLPTLTLEGIRLSAEALP